MYIFLYGIEKPWLIMNTIYIGKFRYIPMIKFETFSVATDEGLSSKLALSKGGSRGSIKS